MLLCLYIIILQDDNGSHASSGATLVANPKRRVLAKAAPLALLADGGGMDQHGNPNVMCHACVTDGMGPVVANRWGFAFHELCLRGVLCRQAALKQVSAEAVAMDIKELQRAPTTWRPKVQGFLPAADASKRKACREVAKAEAKAYEDTKSVEREVNTDGTMLLIQRPFYHHFIGKMKGLSKEESLEEWDGLYEEQGEVWNMSDGTPRVTQLDPCPRVKRETGTETTNGVRQTNAISDECFNVRKRRMERQLRGTGAEELMCPDSPSDLSTLAKQRRQLFGSSATDGKSDISGRCMSLRSAPSTMQYSQVGIITRFGTRYVWRNLQKL
jgi:hypothetical protein